MRQTVNVDTDFGTVTATWQREGTWIVVRYGDRVKKERASDHDAANDFVAKNVLQGWVAEDLKEE